MALLSQMAIWMVETNDWPHLRSLFQTILRNVKLGYVRWSHDWTKFNYLARRPRTNPANGKATSSKEKKATDKKSDVWFCKDYQQDACSHNGPHKITV